MTAPRAFDGTRILAQYEAGPSCTQLLAWGSLLGLRPDELAQLERDCVI